MPKGIPKDGRKPGNPNIDEINKKTRFKKKSEEAVENGKKGVSTKKVIKSFAEEFETLLGETNAKGETYKRGIVKAAINRALSGERDMIELCMKMVHELPNDKVDISVSCINTDALEKLEGVVLNDQRPGD